MAARHLALTWVPLTRDLYRTTVRGVDWLLEATPKASRPWVLYTQREHRGRPVRDKVQEIGAQTLDDARHAAELWFSLGKFCGGTG
ncbi:hypothetical protein EV192_109338 [Actinocrispum wychmicini]|uniref:Uncharacterized protein n=1 Tax=Actinocrispum wychmicini TaxID=1213861 RepID=A0A4R2J827_9PSEU|nr:hypothetical protein EV192_109338 [Actinocrispum wychmicini]